MADVDFEETEWQPKRGEVEDPTANSRVVDSILKTGIAKDAKQANYFLIVSVVVLMFVAGLIFAWAEGWI
jgi:hypothetical protein